MGEKISFSSVGNDLIHNFRERINHSENINDLMDNFSYTVSLFINSVSPTKVSASVSDVRFISDSSKHFEINQSLFEVDEFNQVYHDSDMESIISKFADSANHKYIHLMKHKEKTNSKIKN
jgi:hypothetical protein